MTTGPVRAGAAWLSLREEADAAARSVDLVDRLVDVLVDRLVDRPPASGRLEVHDLGCGTGSMARWLAPRITERITGPQHWVLHDRDADLLARAEVDPPAAAADGAAVTVETRRDDVTRLTRDDLGPADLLTASALLDMMTADDLERFLDGCAAARCPALVTLSVVGRVEITPADPLDRAVMEAFNAHQRRTTGAGPLLGPDAVGAAAAGLRGRGLEVIVRPSPWRLDHRQHDLVLEWFAGWLAPACEQDPSLRGAAADYARRRRSALAEGRLTVTVHHEDLLALPAPRSLTRRSLPRRTRSRS